MQNHMAFINLIGMLVCVVTSLIYVTEARKRYSMYVWTDGFDRDVAGCDLAAFSNWDSSGPCFTHVWNTPEKRAWLWNTCNLAGREVDTIYVSDVHHNLRTAHDNNDCTSSDIAMVKDMLTEGHKKVPNLKIYGLYAVSDLPVSEKDLVKYIVYYNDNCASSATERFDGIATNNEAYTPIKCGDMATRLQYLTDLATIVTEAQKQVNGVLLTHFSISWHWGICDSTPDMMTWNGKSADANTHMIDIFDSVDVQVGYITISAIADRMVTAGIQYAQSLNKPIYTTVYTNEAQPCQITFFPDDTCHIQAHTEDHMFAAFDAFPANNIDYSNPCIHYFRGVYSTGIHPAWPIHNTPSTGHGQIVG
ncbi:hypothetical protein ACF0H5_023175 [Mactra antiquata]